MRKLGVYIIFVIIFCQCTKEPTLTNLFTIPDEFVFNLSQAISDEGAIPAFEVSTINKIGCEEQNLDIAYRFINKQIEIIIKGVDSKVDCEEMKHLSYQVSENLLYGTYDIMISLKGKVENKGLLTIKRDYYSINFEEFNGLIKETSFINRIPDNMIWGSIEISDKSHYSLIDEFHHAMRQTTVPASEAAEPGNYGLFKIKENGDVIVNRKIETETRDNFFYTVNTSMPYDTEWIDQFLEDHPEVKLYLLTPKQVVYQ